MKKLFILIFANFLFINAATAVISTDEAISPEYLLNRGYSPESARLVNFQANRINGNAPTYFGEKSYRWTTKYKPVNNVINYFLDGYVCSDNGKFPANSIHPSPNWNDL